MMSFTDYESDLFDSGIRTHIGEKLSIGEHLEVFREDPDWANVVGVFDRLGMEATHLGSEIDRDGYSYIQAINRMIDYDIIGDVVVDMSIDLYYENRHVRVCYRDILATLDVRDWTIHEVNVFIFITNSFVQFAQLDAIRRGEDIYLDEYNDLFIENNVSYVEWLRAEFEFLFGDDFGLLYDEFYRIHDKLGYFIKINR